MFTPWVFTDLQASSVAAKSPATRYSCEGLVQIFLNFEVWQLMWGAALIDISESGLKCCFSVSDLVSGQKAAELDALIQAEPTARLQINPKIENLYASISQADLVRTERTPEGLMISFQFTETDRHLHELIDALSKPIIEASQKLN